MAEKIKETEQKINQTVQPAVILSNKDKVILAAVRSDDAQFAYVLTLVAYAQKDNKGWKAAQNVYIFESQNQADMFYAASQKMIEINKYMRSGIFEKFPLSLKDFKENVR